MFVSACYAIHLCFVAHFILLALGSPPKHLTIAINASLALVLGLVAASFSMQAPFLWTGASQPAECRYVLLCLRDSRLHSQSPPLARALALAGTAAIACGIHDLFLVRIGIGALASYPLMPHSVFFFVLILAGIVRTATASQFCRSGTQRKSCGTDSRAGKAAHRRCLRCCTASAKSRHCS
jgi:hypothetical protein